MRISIIAVGERMPAWVQQAVAEYEKRFTQECRVEFIDIPAEKRGKNASTDQLLEREAQRIQAAIPARAQVIMLDKSGKMWSSEQLADNMRDWMQQGTDIALLIGGPEGFADSLLQRPFIRWSLSALTYPHPLVRVILVEQLYRALTIIKGHPYHK